MRCNSDQMPTNARTDGEVQNGRVLGQPIIIGHHGPFFPMRPNMKDLTHYDVVEDHLKNGI